MHAHNVTAQREGKADKDELRKLHRQVKARRLRKYVRAYSSLPSRHYLHSGNHYAVQMLCDDFQRIFEKDKDDEADEDNELDGVTVTAMTFEHEGQLLKNVEARVAGTMDGDEHIVLICAHLDSTADGDPGYQPLLDAAPGADDNASGIAAVLLAAHVVAKLRRANNENDNENDNDKKKKKKVPHREIRFVLFNAEEARQAGSRKYVESLSAGSAAAYNIDMIGYRSSENIFEVHAGFEGPSTKDPKERAAAGKTQDESLVMAAFVEEFQKKVSPTLKVQIYPGEDDKRDVGEGFGDHTSFHRKGIAACLVTENFFTGPGTIDLAEPNPNHHLPEDRLDHLDFEYAADIARAVAAAAWHMATVTEWPLDKPAKRGPA